MAIASVDLEALSQTILQAGWPLHINVLIRVAVEGNVRTAARRSRYAPDCRYTTGETILFGGQWAIFKTLRPGGNPKQGSFTILTLVLPGGSQRYVAAEVPGAPADSALCVRCPGG